MIIAYLISRRIPVSTPLTAEQIEELLPKTPGRFKTIAELKEVVVANDNVLTVTMQDLRDAYGALRLGVNVRNDITKRLAGNGLGHYPTHLPAYQHEAVRLFTLGSAVADLIQAALTPGEEHDELLRSKAESEAAMIVEKIRALVCSS
jgi:hypothetical protein